MGAPGGSFDDLSGLSAASTSLTQIDTARTRIELDSRTRGFIARLTLLVGSGGSVSNQLVLTTREPTSRISPRARTTGMGFPGNQASSRWQASSAAPPQG